MTTQDRFQGCLLGLACGDAVGTTVEFKGRGTFPPVTDMHGGGPFRLQAGQWTDDTAMALCLAASLTELKRFDPRDQMEPAMQFKTLTTVPILVQVAKDESQATAEGHLL